MIELKTDLQDDIETKAKAVLSGALLVSARHQRGAMLMPPPGGVGGGRMGRWTHGWWPG